MHPRWDECEMKRSTGQPIVQRLQRHKLEISHWALHERLDGVMSEMEPTTGS